MIELKAEVFQARSFDCPRCGEMMYYRKNLDALQMPYYPIIRCPCCRFDVTKAGVIILMIHQKTRDGYSFICNDCGRSNFSLWLPERCQFCS